MAPRCAMKVLDASPFPIRITSTSCTVKHPRRHGRAVLDAVRHGDTTDEVAGDPQSGEGFFDLFRPLHEAAVADLVLRDRPRPAADPAEGGLAAQLQGTPELAQHRREDAVVVPGGE